MTVPGPGSEPREIATFVLPGAVGLGLGTFLGLVVADALFVVALLGVVGALAGHAVGYLLLER